MKEGYIGGPTGGIPESIFAPGAKTGEIEGASGATLRYTVRPEICNIGVVGETDTRFRANIIGETLNLAIHSKDQIGRRHPDIYAGELVRQFVIYAKDHGQTISRIKGSWNPTSDNYRQFRAYLDEIAQEREVTETDAVAAANQTWTGQLASSLGYERTRVLKGWKHTTMVEVQFREGYPIRFEDL